MSSIEYNWDKFEYPIDSFLRGDGTWKCSVVLGDPKETIVVNPINLVNVTKFTKVYYFQEGENDEAAWIFFAKHSNGFYVFFEASCDYSGFDCQGGGSIVYSKDPRRMYWQGLTDCVRGRVKDFLDEVFEGKEPDDFYMKQH